MWHCLIIEDDRENASYLANGLIEMGHSVVVCYDGVEALHNAMRGPWDVIILDRMLPNDVDGLSILQTLRALGKRTPVLVLSALAAVDDRVRGFKAGGDDYLVKPFAFSELAARLEALVNRSRTSGDEQELCVADLTANLVTRKAQRAGLPIALQPREFRLLVYLMKNSERVVTRTMLLEAVWDYRFDPQSNVIDVQVSRLRRKVDAGFPQALIHTVRGAGYMLSSKGAPDSETMGAQ